MRYIFGQSLVICLLHIQWISAAPGGVAVGAIGIAKPPITFGGGDVGVNFGGYHASAGLGGLLDGGAAGGLHAEAGTSHGQEAAAGLGGIVAEGETSGGLYAAADSGAGASAGTAFGGTKTISGSFGGSVSGASAGNAYVSKTVVHEETPVVYHETVKVAPQVQKTYVERTVIPNYVEKTIQVPSYVEKTIRVPTVVEKKVRVPAAPTIIEKTISAPPQQAHAEYNGQIETTGHVGGGGAILVENTRPAVYKHWSYRKRPLFGGFFAGGSIDGGAGAGSYNSYGTGYSGGGGAATYTYRKAVNPQIVNDIFNIPISTLGAVSKLVGGIANGAGAGGSLSFSKSVSLN